MRKLFPIITSAIWVEIFDRGPVNLGVFKSCIEYQRKTITSHGSIKSRNKNEQIILCSKTLSMPTLHSNFTWMLISRSKRFTYDWKAWMRKYMLESVANPLGMGSS